MFGWMDGQMDNGYADNCVRRKGVRRGGSAKVDWEMEAVVPSPVRGRESLTASPELTFLWLSCPAPLWSCLLVSLHPCLSYFPFPGIALLLFTWAQAFMTGDTNPKGTCLELRFCPPQA
jgi:hypothetical protein